MKKILWFFLSGLAPLSVVIAALYIFDPYQFFHKPIFRKTTFSSDMYYQAAGIINNYEFDSVILGSSILVNTSSFEASQKLNGKWVNLSAGGASIEIRAVILHHALENKKINKVIFSLEPNWVFGKNDAINKYAHLYDKNYFNDFQTYINEYFIACIFLNKLCLRGEENLDRPANWINETTAKMRLGGFQAWLNNAKRPDLNSVMRQILAFRKTKDNNLNEFPNSLIDLARQHPQTDFILIIPPFSRLFYKINFISSYPAIKKVLLSRLKNIQIYGFDNTTIPDDIARYSDLVHYDEKVNSFMLDAIKNDTHRITLENIDSYFEEMKKKVENYDIEPLRKQIIESGVLEN